MDLTDIPEYRQYARHVAYGNAPSAEEALLVCLGQVNDEPTKALVFHFLASLYEIDHDKEKCLKYYDSSEQIDPNSLEPLRLQVQFMLRHAELKLIAIDKIQEMKKRLANEDNLVFEGAMDRDYYLAKVSELEASIT